MKKGIQIQITFLNFLFSSEKKKFLNYDEYNFVPYDIVFEIRILSFRKSCMLNLFNVVIFLLCKSLCGIEFHF